MCTLGRLSGSVLARAVAVRCAAAAGGGGRSEGGLAWTLGGARGFRSAAVAMAPIKVGDAIPSVVVFEGEETDLLLDDALVPLFGNRRLKRFSMVIENGVVKALNVEPDGTGLTCSLAPNILSQL
uniref:Peroxiredoxin 5 n=1 Tax=Pipistrellus kuhlii TaxID=59472 RepID=A0A7J7RTN5_PIPKU|nr:peroxiredoxin 5 [Pipistrellus kuhlii]